MLEVRQTEAFIEWLSRLSDSSAARIVARIRRIEIGNFGDAKSVGGGVSELRINYGSGFRVYFTRRGNTIVILLCGGDKKTQRRDIAKAQQMAKEV